jgi:putative endonuclease
VRPNRRDELDLVARRDDTLAFVEVKTRRGEGFGRPAAAVNRRKRHSLCRGAAAYLRRAGHPALFYRFDVIEVVGRPGATPVIRHIEDAFRFEARYRFPAG